MTQKFYYAIHIQIDEKYGYSIAVSNDKHLDENSDEQEIIKLAIMGNFFEEDTDYRLVDSVYEITEKEYKENFVHSCDEEIKNKVVYKKLKEEKETILKDIINTELLKRGFNVKFNSFLVTDRGIKFETESFQTQPIIFKNIMLSSAPSSYMDNDTKIYVVRVLLFYDTFIGGSNGTELFTIYIAENNFRPYIKCCK